MEAYCEEIKVSVRTELTKRFLQRYPSGVTGLLVDIVEYDDEEEIGLRLYRENFEDLSESDRQKVAEWLQVVIPTLGKYRIPAVLEVSDYVPNRRDS